MPLQIKRHLIILVLFTGVFLIIRHLLIPDSFGDLGHYRANSLIDNESHELHYAGQETCTECHEENAELKEMDLHSELSCETCHGPGLAHNESPDSVDLNIPVGRKFCANCHAKNAARDKDVVFQIDLSEHNVDRDCNYCHNPHAPWELRNQDLPEENF